jgi:hypothetical protein
MGFVHHLDCLVTVLHNIQVFVTAAAAEEMSAQVALVGGGKETELLFAHFALQDMLA